MEIYKFLSLKVPPKVSQQVLSCLVSQSCPTLQPHGLQHTSLPCLSLSLRVCSNSCPLNQWCHPTISSSVIPFSSWLQSFSSSGSFPMSWLFASSSQSIGALASTSVLPMNIQGWFPLGLVDLLAVQETLKSLLLHHSLKASILWHSAFFMVHLTSVHDNWKNYSLDYMDICWQRDVFAF